MDVFWARARIVPFSNITFQWMCLLGVLVLGGGSPNESKPIQTNPDQSRPLMKGHLTSSTGRWGSLGPNVERQTSRAVSPQSRGLSFQIHKNGREHAQTRSRLASFCHVARG